MEFEKQVGLNQFAKKYDASQSDLLETWKKIDALS